MATGNIPVLQGDSISLPDGTKINLGIVYERQLYVLMGELIGNTNAALSNPATIQNGTAIYYKIVRNLPKDYSFSDAYTNLADLTEREQIYVNLDAQKILSYTIETNDLKRLGFKYQEGGMEGATAFLNGLSDAQAKSVQLYYFSKYTNLAVATAVANTTFPIQNLPILNASGTLNIPSGEQQFDFLQKNLIAPINNLIAKFQSFISPTIITIDRKDIFVAVSPTAYNFFVQSTTNLGDSARETLLNWKLTQISGLNIFINPLLSQNLPVNKVDQNEVFNFTAVDILVGYKEALANPISTTDIFTNKQPSTNNIIFGHKFMVNSNGGVALRPELVAGFKLTTTSNPTDDILRVSNLDFEPTKKKHIK